MEDEFANYNTSNETQLAIVCGGERDTSRSVTRRTHANAVATVSPTYGVLLLFISLFCCYYNIVASVRRLNANFIPLSVIYNDDYNVSILLRDGVRENAVEESSMITI